MIFRLRVFLRLLQSIFGSARRTSPFLFQLIAAYLKLKFGFGSRKGTKSRTATKARKAQNSSKSPTESAENTCKKHAAGHRLSLFHSSHISKLSSEVSRFSVKALKKVKSIKHARKSIFTLTRSPEKTPILSSPSTSAASKVTFVVPFNPASPVTRAKATPDMEVVQIIPPVETPELWRKISAPLRTPERISTTEWQVQGRTRRNGSTNTTENVTEKQTEEAIENVYSTPVLTLTKNTPGPFYTRENPYKVLEGLGDDAFQVPQRKQSCFSLKRLSRPDDTPTQTTTEESPVPVPVSASTLMENLPTITSSPIKIPGIPSAWNSTQTLATDPEEYTTSFPEPVNYSTVVEDLDVARMIKNRRRQNARTPTQALKGPILTPTRDTVESFRKASSPLRTATPTNTHNGWQPVQKRRRRATGHKKADFGASPIPNHSLETLPASIGPNTVTTGTSGVVILHKNTRPTVSVSV